MNNSNYVSYEETVKYQLSLQPGINLIFRAEDNSHIADLEAQAVDSPEGAIMIISSGGNDLMKQPNLPALDDSFDSYMNIIHQILDRYKPKKLYMVNLYLPTSMALKPLHPHIKKWNSKLRKFVDTNPRLGLIEIDKDCKTEADFTEVYEPSGICSRKIAGKIREVLISGGFI